MSNKNLKVYKMQFITEVKKLYFNVKFNCSVKMIWKRSNETAETTLVPIKAGVVDFNQTLRLNVSMYFDTTTTKFVQKKCLYSFLISTEKGQKSAGSVTIDLAQFFNKRIYEMEDSFLLQKCPVNGTKVEMKIHYEQQATQQQGYDSMSCISSTNQLDSSVASMDLGEFSQSKSNLSQKKSQIQTEKSQKSKQSVSQKQLVLTKEQNYGKLDDSDVQEYSLSPQKGKQGNKIGQNIRTINTLTSKINDFVNSKSKSIRFEIQEKKRKINQLQEQLQAQKTVRQKVQNELQQEKKKSSDLQREFLNYKDEIMHKLQTEKRKNDQLEQKANTTQHMLTQLQSRMSQSGQSQTVYIQQLKNNSIAIQSKLNMQIDELRENVVQQKKIKNQLNSKVSELQGQLKDLKQKYGQVVDKNSTMEQDMRRKQQEIEATRINLQKTFENLVTSLGNLI